MNVTFTIRLTTSDPDGWYTALKDVLDGAGTISVEKDPADDNGEDDFR